MGKGANPNRESLVPLTSQDNADKKVVIEIIDGGKWEPAVSKKNTDSKVTHAHIVAAVITVSLISIIALSAGIAALKKQHIWPAGFSAKGIQTNKGSQQTNEVRRPCDDGWIWYWGKCFLFSEDEGTWTNANDTCAALQSSLAVIDNPHELNFVKHYKRHHDRWIGLKRLLEQPWKWPNGTEFNNWFTIKDSSDCAFLHHGIIRSDQCYNTRKWICTKASIN